MLASVIVAQFIAFNQNDLTLDKQRANDAQTVINSNPVAMCTLYGQGCDTAVKVANLLTWYVLTPSNVEEQEQQQIAQLASMNDAQAAAVLKIENDKMAAIAQAAQITALKQGEFVDQVSVDHLRDYQNFVDQKTKIDQKALDALNAL